MVLASVDLSYCFDIKIEAERKIAKKNVSSKWSPIVYKDDFVTGWKVAKNWPSWTFDANAWKKIVIDIQDKAAGLRGLLSPGEFFVMIFPLAIVLTWMKEVLKTMKKKKY